MVETATTTPPPAPPKKARTGVPKSTGITLKDPAGNVMRLTATTKKDGTAQTYVIHRSLDEHGKTKEITRGATQAHANLDAARAMLDKIKAKAVGGGWIEKVSRVGKSKPDAFDINSLPVAKKAKK